MLYVVIDSTLFLSIIMLGTETETDVLEAFGSYHQMKSKESVQHLDDDYNANSDESGFVDHVEEQGQELLLPTVTRYGLVKRYKSTLRKQVQKYYLEYLLYFVLYLEIYLSHLFHHPFSCPKLT